MSLLKNTALFVLVFVLLLPNSFAAEIKYEQKDVALPQGIVGTLCQPDLKGKVPTVLLLHGFASSKDEVGDMYKRLAQKLCQRGIASLRFGYRGWGESKGEMKDITLRTEAEDVVTAYQYLTRLNWVDIQRIGIVGFSMGGALSVITASQHPNWFKTMVLWSSVGDLDKDFLTGQGQKNKEIAAKNGEVNIDLGWRKITLGYGFYQSLDDYDLQKMIEAYHHALFVIAGSEDFSAAYLQPYIDNVQSAEKKSLVIPKANHIFNVLSPDGSLNKDQTDAEKVLTATTNWLQKTL